MFNRHFLFENLISKNMFKIHLVRLFLCLVFLTSAAVSGASFPNWPSASGDQTVSATIVYSGGTYDMKNKRFTASSALGDGSQSEGQKPLFRLSNGTVLLNAIIGLNGADGIHCYDSCTLQNVWSYFALNIVD